MAAVDWVTRQQVKDQLEISGTGRDTLLDAAITAASNALNRRCKREITPRSTAVTRTFSFEPAVSDEARITVDLAPYDLRTATTVTLNPEDSSPTVLTSGVDYSLWPVGGRHTTGTYTGVRLSRYVSGLWSTFANDFGEAKLSVLGDWGVWDTANVPEDVKRACIVTVGSWIDKAIADYGGDFGDQPRVMQATMFDGYAIPRAALNILSAAELIRFRLF